MSNCTCNKLNCDNSCPYICCRESGNATFNKIFNIALEIRSLVLYEMESDDITGLCHYASEKLQEYLSLNGIKATLIKGTFRVDKLDDRFMDFLGVKVTKEDLLEGHYWLEYNGWIIDITADQFNYQLENESYPEITIGKIINLPRHKALTNSF